jgi:hypothetical protein
MINDSVLTNYFGRCLNALVAGDVEAFVDRAATAEHAGRSDPFPGGVAVTQGT